MNSYVEVVNQVVDYIEENIHEQIRLEDLSKQACLSEFHFNRMFRAMVGTSPKQYILGRKLTHALMKLNKPGQSVIDVAYDLQFAYPEAFSRAFKKQFGISPAQYRTKSFKVVPVEKAVVVARDFVNYNGGLTLKSQGVHLESFEIKGLSVSVNTGRPDFEEKLLSAAAHFSAITQSRNELEQEHFYTVVNCSGEDDGEYTVFYGRKVINSSGGKDLLSRMIPGGWYASFFYRGDMLDIRTTFEDDLYQWIAAKGIQLRSNGIGMLNVYDKNYEANPCVGILVPVAEPE